MRLMPVLLLLPLLAGCTDSDWNRLLSYGGSGSAEDAPAQVATVAPPPAPTPQPAPAPQVPAATAPATTSAAAAAAQLDPFCLGIARQDAMTHDFDAPTQQKVAARSYQQCVQIFGATAN